ncbi:MAG: glycosyltransferase family 2 protein [Burkholderiales bacterium]|jgi:glycosyltransferase involved in cell wall biosynthesis
MRAFVHVRCTDEEFAIGDPILDHPTSMQVSVIVPLYNKAAYVSRCLRSVLAQTHEDFETLVIDDGSSDGGGRLVESFAAPNLRLVRQDNAGPGAARNRGLREARGKYVAFLDADDEWLPQYLAASVRVLEQTPNAAAATSAYFEGSHDDSLERFWRRRGITPGLKQVTSGMTPQQLVHMVAYMLPCSTVARIEVLREFGGFYDRDRCRYAEDAFLWLQLALNRPVVFHPEPLVRIHRDAAQLSRNLRAARPIEPFLQRPDLVRATCPPGLETLLEGFLTARAFKTACVLGYWGQWREARSLRRAFARPGSWRFRYALPSVLCATPLGAWAGSAWRKMRALELPSAKRTPA